jgi:hypothetical protein
MRLVGHSLRATLRRALACGVVVASGPKGEQAVSIGNNDIDGRAPNVGPGRPVRETRKAALWHRQAGFRTNDQRMFMAPAAAIPPSSTKTMWIMSRMVAWSIAREAMEISTWLP